MKQAYLEDHPPVTVAILKNGREGDVFGFIIGFCSDGQLGETGFPGDPNFNQVTFPATSAGASQPCTKFQSIVVSAPCFISINGLTAGDSICLPDGAGGTTCTPMEQVGGVAVRFQSTTPGINVAVGVAMDTTLCNGNGYWTRGPANAQISMPGNVLLYHELVGHAKHHCDGDFNAGDPEGQAIAEENILRALEGIETRTSHEGGCGGGSTGCFIASAAYGSPTAPEVQTLRTLRDSVVRTTSWGDVFFDEIYRQYYSISPPIAARISANPELAEAVRLALVEPWTIGLQLLQALPADTSDPASAIAFAELAADRYAAWARGLPLARAKPGPEVIGTELVAILARFPNRQLRSAALQRLADDGVLPLTDPTSDLVAAIRSLALPSADEDLVLGLTEP